MALRFTASGLLFILIALMRGVVTRVPTGREILSAAFLGVFLLILGNGIITWVEKSVDSHLAALILATIPLVVALYNGILYKTKLDFRHIGGMLAGAGGAALLLIKDQGGGILLTPGIILVIAVVFCWAFGTAFSLKLTPYPDILVHTGIQMLIAAIISRPVAVVHSSCRDAPHIYRTVPYTECGKEEGIRPLSLLASSSG
ncbi:MAG: EamA family transporter [Spirochaetales bacterium]|nr:EamA family transporter [Spirochaetales bacterium]